jgi:hypothetical protein
MAADLARASGGARQQARSGEEEPTTVDPAS